MLARTHLFGSTDGYRTLARSPDICDADDAALAALGFGSPRTEAEFEALEHELCVAGRPLPSGGYAITRVFAGAPDVAGRRTIERRTLIVETEDWGTLAACDLLATLQDSSNWPRDAFLSGRPVTLHVHDPRDLLATPTEPARRAFDALLAANEVGRCAALPHAEPWTSAILRLPNLLPKTQALLLGWGIGLWAVPAGVWIATLHPSTSPRNAFHAHTSGPWQHPEAVMQLGQDFVARPAGTSPQTPRRRRRNLGRHLPLLAGLAAMLVASLMVWWAVRKRESLERGGDDAPARSRRMEGEIASTPAMPAVAATPITPGSEAPAATPPHEPTLPSGADAATSRPSAQPVQAESTKTVAPPPAPAETDAFGVAARTTASDAFGSGTSAVSAPPTPTDMAPDPAPSVAAPAPAPAPTPAERPNIPQIPAESAPWDAEVDLARKSIDLRARAREVTTTAQGAALLVSLAAQAEDLVRAHRRTEKAAGNAGPGEKCLILIDARNRKRGLTDVVKREQLAQAFAPLVVQRMMLLCARFEISLAVQDLARRNLIDTGALPRELRGDARADGWPDETPWVLWYFRNKDAPVSTAADGARYMASEFDGALDGHPGTRGAQQILETLAKPAPSEASP